MESATLARTSKSATGPHHQTVDLKTSMEINRRFRDGRRRAPDHTALPTKGDINPNSHLLGVIGRAERHSVSRWFLSWEPPSLSRGMADHVRGTDGSNPFTGREAGRTRRRSRQQGKFEERGSRLI